MPKVPGPLVRDPIASLAPTQDAQSPVPFARNTVLGPRLIAHGPKSGLAIAAVIIRNRGYVQRDPPEPRFLLNPFRQGCR